MIKRIASFAIAFSIVFSGIHTAYAEKVNVAYSNYSADIETLKTNISEIKVLLETCEDNGISTDYEIMRVNVVERYTHYLEDELNSGVGYRTTENGYTEDDVKNIYDYNVNCLKEISERTIADLNSYLAGTKTPFEVPKMLTSKTETDGHIIYADVEKNGTKGKEKVFLNGVGHYDAYEDMDFLKATGNDILQMQIGISSHCVATNHIKDWVGGWYLKPEYTVERVTTEHNGGNASLKITNKTGRQNNYYYAMQQGVKVEPNTEYTYSFFAKGSNINHFVYKTTANNSFRWIGLESAVNLGEWTQYSVTYTTGENQTEDRIYLSTEGITDELYIDDVKLVKKGTDDNLLLNGGFEEEEDPEKVIDSDPSKLWKYEEIFKEAEEKNMKISLLLSPQYFVNELYNIYPDLKGSGDTLGFVMLHPVAVKALKYHIETVLNIAKKYKSVNDICLVNEPKNETKAGGENSFYKNQWTDYLTEQYGSVENLNKAWSKNYSKIADAEFPSSANLLNKMSYDYIHFNDLITTEWVKMLSETAKNIAPELPIHMKIMPYISSTEDYDKRWLIGAGVNPEKVSSYMDISGNDSEMRFVSGSEKSYSEFLEQKRFAQSMWYEYLGSIKDAPVFNSEDHIIANGNKDYDIAHRKLISVSQWMGAVHGRNMDCMWIWDRSSDKTETYESIMYRPDVYEKMCEVNLDLKRLANEVYAIMDAEGTVGVLYSETSRIYSKTHINAVNTAFESIVFNGGKAKFITENTEEAEYKLIIVPYVPYVKQNTVNLLKNHIKNGGKVIIIGNDSLKYDENSIEYTSDDVKYIRENSTIIAAKPSNDVNYIECNTSELLQNVAKEIKALNIADVELRDSKTGERTFDVEYMSVDYNGGKLINICNYDWDNDKTVTLYIDGKKTEYAKELRNGKNLFGDFTIKSYEPILIFVPGGNAEALIENVYTSDKSVYFNIVSKESINNAVGIVAVYNMADNRLEDVKFTEITADKHTIVPKECNFDFDLKNKKISVMLWDNLSGIKPLAVSVNIPDES